MTHQIENASLWNDRRFLGLPPKEELRFREEEIREADPNQGDTPLFIGERLDLITKIPELLEATGYSSEKEYLRASMERLGLSTSAAYEYRRAYRVLKKYRKHIRKYCPDLNLQDGYLGKLLLLDAAVRFRCRSNDDPATMEEVIGHFLKDSYRGFKFYAKPGLEQEELWRKKLKAWKKVIIGELKAGYKIYMLYYQPTEEVNDFTLRSFIIDACKEVKA
jgi:hypothetical protein